MVRKDKKICLHCRYSSCLKNKQHDSLKKKSSNCLSKKHLNFSNKIPSATYRVFSSNSDIKNSKTFVQKEISVFSINKYCSITSLFLSLRFSRHAVFSSACNRVLWYELRYFCFFFWPNGLLKLRNSILAT